MLALNIQTTTTAKKGWVVIDGWKLNIRDIIQNQSLKKLFHKFS